MNCIRRLAAAVLVLVLAACGCLAEEMTSEQAQAAFEEELASYEADDTVLDPSEEIVFQDSATSEYLADALEAAGEMQNILLLGIDARPGEKTGRSDTMIILTVDPEQNVIRMVSLMRDLYVEIPGHKNNRLNAAYVLGGAELLMQTIEQNFGIHVERYVGVNFSMLANLIDQMGGLELNVESDYYVDRINAVIKCDNKVLGLDVNDGLLESAGLQTLTGKQAQAYARYRYGTSDGDFGRTQRQREVILKIWEKLRGMTLVQLFKLTGDNLDNVFTNLTPDEILELVPAALQLQDAEVQQLRIPIDGGYSNKTVSGMAVLVPDRVKNKEALAEFYGQ